MHSCHNYYDSITCTIASSGEYAELLCNVVQLNVCL